MKPFTISAALMSDQYTTETTIDTSPGYLRFGRFTIRDAANYGVIDFEKLLIKSSNVGASKIALLLPQDAIWNMDYELGIGSPVGIGFPGEASGVLPSHPKWHPSEIATSGFLRLWFVCVYVAASSSLHDIGLMVVIEFLLLFLSKMCLQMVSK